MLRSKSLKVAGLLLIVVLLLISISSVPAFAKDRHTQKHQTVQNTDNGSKGGYVAAGVGIIAIFVIGVNIFGRKADGSTVHLGRTDSKTPRSEISRNSGR